MSSIEATPGTRRVQTQRLGLSIVLVFLLAGCLPATPAPVGVVATSIPTGTAAVKPQAKSSPTATPTPPAVAVIPTRQGAATSQAPGAWTFFDPRDPSLPDLILPGADGYHLDPTWEVARVDYLYKWWGMGLPAFDYQYVEYQDGGYRRGADLVKARSVSALLEAVSHLHPSQFLLSDYGHWDDYPSWAVEIVGLDGQRVLLFSDNINNPGSGPWNVLHNGRLYAQYDGSLARPIADLFPCSRRSPTAGEADQVSFHTKGWPSQLRDGFGGLLPIAEGFRYWADPESGQIHGYIEGRSSIGYMTIGSVTKLNYVEIEVAGGRAVTCTFEAVPVADPVTVTSTRGAAWTFTCSPGDAVPGARYRYPIRAELETDDGEVLRTEGELWGAWDPVPGTPLLPPAEEMQAVLAGHEPAVDLLTDHVLVWATYDSATVNFSDVQSGTMTGEITLLGQTEFDQRPLRYTIGFPFAVQDSRMTRWDLTRPALLGMLQDILPLALTRRVVETDPTAVLNLWYAEAEPDRPYEVKIGSCADNPGRTFPQKGEPLRAFAFNHNWGFWQVDFVLMDGKPVVADLDLWPNADDRGGLLSILIPPQLDTGPHTPFERIWIDSFPYSGSHPRLTLWIPENADAASMEAYRRIAASLPVHVSQEYDTLWEAEGLTFVVTDDGTLDVVACEGPRQHRKGRY